MPSSYTRRRVLQAGAAAGLAVTAPRLVYAQNKRTVTYTLPWVAEGSNLVNFVAKGMGFWDKHGLDVQISRGYGSTAAAEAIGAGQFEFGLSAAPSGILQVVKGLQIVQLACCAYDATMGIGVLDDGPIKSPKDLEGRQMASTSTSGEFVFLPAFAQQAGFDLSKVQIVQVDNKVRDRLLPEHKVDAMSGYASTAMPTYVATGVKAHFMLYSAFGMPLYGNTLMTQPARLAQAPELCAAVVDGLLQGMKATMLDPAEAIKVFFKQVPEMALASQAKEQIRVGTGLMIYAAARQPMKEHGVGYLVPKDFETMTDLVMKYIARPGDKRPEISTLMTNKFVGDMKLSDAEWAQTQSNAKDFRQYVS